MFRTQSKKRISRPINKSNRKLNIMKNKIIILLSTLTFSTTIFAQTWIWYPGDYEIWLGNKMNNRRTERGAFFPPFWKTDSHFVVVEFSKQLNLPQPSNSMASYNLACPPGSNFRQEYTVLISKCGIKLRHRLFL